MSKKISATQADHIMWAMLCHKTAHEHLLKSNEADERNDLIEGRAQFETYKNWSRYRDEALIKAFGMTHEQMRELSKKSAAWKHYVKA